jgi:hypothetical protein
MPGPDDLDVISGRLEAIAEELDDLVTDRLRQAVSSGAEGGEPDSELIDEERRISRARRAVAKAADILRRPEKD